MNRTVISSQDIQVAKRTGKKFLELPSGALVTPLAREEARDGGLVLRENSGGSDSVPESPAAPQNSPADNREELPGVLTARSADAADAAESGALRLREALTPGPGGPGISVLCWQDASFTWTFETTEVVVVTEGLLMISLSGKKDKTLKLGSGEAALVRAGTSLTLAARGTVRCICSSWPV